MSAYAPVRHLSEEDLERYATGKAGERLIADVEEHLLICEECRRALDETEIYLKEIVVAARELRKTERRSWAFAAPARLGWAIAAGLALIGGIYWLREAPRTAPMPAATVLLEAIRGPVSHAPADRPLILQPDLAGLPAADHYLLEVVDEQGGKVWEGKLPASAARATVSGQKTGVYFVRVYSPDRKLLREYGLRLTK